jgi:putative pyruvate formate lyase activating enzyme
VDAALFARICLVLQERGAENINLVTGSHAVPVLAAYLAGLKDRGLAIPALWNSSAYELPETLDLLSGAADIFVPDLKTLDRDIAARYFHAPDYPEIAPAAIKKMISLRPLVLVPAGGAEGAGGAGNGPERLVSGVMVRHLVLPGRLPASREVLRWFAGHCAGRALLSLMFQYTPPDGPANSLTGSPAGSPAGGPARTVSREEYETVLGWLDELGIEDGYCQEFLPESAFRRAGRLPDFNRANPFPPDLAVPVWHWREGFL